jgi:hypothetical protein
MQAFDTGSSGKLPVSILPYRTFQFGRVSIRSRSNLIAEPFTRNLSKGERKIALIESKCRSW